MDQRLIVMFMISRIFAVSGQDEENLEFQEVDEQYWLYSLKRINCTSFLPAILLNSIKSLRQSHPNASKQEYTISRVYLKECLRKMDKIGTEFPFNGITESLAVQNKSAQRPFDLSYSFAINNLIDLDFSGNLVIKVTFNFFYNNQFKKWEEYADMNGGIKYPGSVTLKVGEMWHPVMLLSNCQDKNCIIKPDNETFITLDSDGDCVLEFETIISSTCDASLIEFPFDEQNCSLEMYFQDIELRFLLNITNADKNYLTTKSDSDEWAIISLNYYNKITREKAFILQSDGIWKEVIDESAYERTGIKVDVILRRHPTYYIYNIILPLFAILFIGIITLLLPAGSDRLNLVLLLFVSFIYLQTLIAETVPKTQNSPNILRFIIAALMTTVLNVVGLIAVMMFDNFPEENLPPLIVRIIIIRPFNIFLSILKCKASLNHNNRSNLATFQSENMPANSFQIEQTTNSSGIETGKPGIPGESEKREFKNEDENWKRFAYILDWGISVIFLALIIFSLVYFFFVPLLPAYSRYLKGDKWYTSEYE